MTRASRAAPGKRGINTLSLLVDRIYEASLQPQLWCDVVLNIADSMDAPRALMLTPYLAPQHGGLVFPARFPEADLQLWATTYIEQDVWAINAARKNLFRTGLVSLDDEMLPRDEFLASPFFREFLQPIGIGRVCAGVVFGGSPDLPGMVLSMYRAQHDPAFTQDDKHWMQLLLPHVSRAVGIMQRLDTARAQNASLLASFDRLKFGVILLNGAMQVLHLNQAALRVMQRDDGLKLSSERRLLSHHNWRGQNLAQWIAALHDAPPDEQAHLLDGFLVSRTTAANGEKSRYMLQCAPVAAVGAWQAQRETVRYAVFVTDPSVVHLPGTNRLRELYGLTQTQARITREFAQGGTYNAVAARLRISEETVRWHVKDIYPKLRVNRLADLVRVVLSLGQSSV